MEKQDSQHSYTVEDLNKAYDMGIESAVVVLEKSLGLSPAEQRYLLNRMKMKIIEDKIAAIRG
jgi:hypothetical protein